MNREDKKLIKFVLTAPPGQFANWLYSNPQGVTYAITLLSQASQQELSEVMNELYNESFGPVVAEATSEEDPVVEAYLEQGNFPDAKAYLKQFTLKA